MNRRISVTPAELPESLQALAAHFTAVSGLSCTAVDADGQNLALAPISDSVNDKAGDVDSGCAHCRRINDWSPARTCDGTSIHRDGICQAKRFGGSFVYFCPANLVYWTAPVVYENQVIGALVAGSVLMDDPEDNPGDECRAAIMSTTDDGGQLRQRFKAIPYVSPARVSSLAKVLGDMAFSLSQKFANNALWETHVEGQQARISEYIHQLKIDNETEKRPNYPVAKERALLSLIAQGDHANANQLLNELLGFILFASGRDIALIKARVLELVVLMSRAALEGGAPVDSILKMNDTFLAQAQKTTSIDDLSASLAVMLKRFSECVFTLRPTRHADLAHKAVQYLNARYSQRIDLQTMADHFHLSAAHFSKVFKEETGQGFVHALSQIRVQRSQDLLRDPSIGLAEIAELVGFDDQSYFTRVFKKHVGMSPGKYRSCRGLLAEERPAVRQDSHQFSSPYCG
ncbi:MAG: helix-turn-helix domain-containing protein [Propionivibrio sp.]